MMVVLKSSCKFDMVVGGGKHGVTLVAMLTGSPRAVVSLRRVL